MKSAKLDHERMLQDAVFTEETTSDDLILARALLAERSPEDIAAALARLYRARLPSPEDILDPGQGSGRPRDDHGRENVRTSHGDDRPRARSKLESSSRQTRAGSAAALAGIENVFGRRSRAR